MPILSSPQLTNWLERAKNFPLSSTWVLIVTYSTNLAEVRLTEYTKLLVIIVPYPYLTLYPFHGRTMGVVPSGASVRRRSLIPPLSNHLFRTPIEPERTTAPPGTASDCALSCTAILRHGSYPKELRQKGSNHFPVVYILCSPLPNLAVSFIPLYLISSYLSTSSSTLIDDCFSIFITKQLYSQTISI